MLCTFVGVERNLGFESAGCWSLAFDRVKRPELNFSANDAERGKASLPVQAYRFTGCSLLCFKGFHLKGLILAQNERWRRGLGMQVEREVHE